MIAEIVQYPVATVLGIVSSLSILATGYVLDRVIAR